MDIANSQIHHQRKVILKLMNQLHKERKANRSINELLKELIYIAQKKRKNVILMIIPIPATEIS